MVIRLVFMPGLSFFGNYPLFFFAFGEINGRGSVSLKLRVCDAAYPWSQSPSTLPLLAYNFNAITYTGDYAFLNFLPKKTTLPFQKFL